MSRGAPRASATSAATGTPPLGRPSTTSWRPARCWSLAASCRPASTRSLNNIARALHDLSADRSRVASVIPAAAGRQPATGPGEGGLPNPVDASQLAAWCPSWGTIAVSDLVRRGLTAPPAGIASRTDPAARPPARQGADNVSGAGYSEKPGPTDPPRADHAGSERVVPVSSGNPDDKLGGALRDGPQ